MALLKAVIISRNILPACLKPLIAYQSKAVAVKQILGQRVEAMKDLIKYIVRALVDHPEQIEISEITSEQVTLKSHWIRAFFLTVYRNILLNISGTPSLLKG